MASEHIRRGINPDRSRPCASGISEYRDRIIEGARCGGADLEAIISHRSKQTTKIHIIGGPGSGKTTLARLLAKRLEVSVFELDTIAEQCGIAPGFRIICPLDKRLTDVAQIASLPGWITEGSYLWWTNELLRRADLIIWLDVPWHVGIRRILARHVGEYVAAITRQTSLRQFLRVARYPHVRHLADFVPYTWAYYRRRSPVGLSQPEDMDDARAITRARTSLDLKAYKNKVVRCSTADEIAHLMDTLCEPAKATPLASDRDHSVNPRKREMTMSGGITSKYAESHKADWVPTNYDEVIYDPKGYDTFAWHLQRPYLVRIFKGLATSNKKLKYLDFACGTGRIISAVEHLTDQAVGLDISPQMLTSAKPKVSKSVLKCGDILEDPDIVDSDYDVITAFRFFLNTEPEMRVRVMHSLAGRLSDRDSRLIFNVHGNAWSADALKSLYQQMRGWGPANTMTYPDVQRLVEGAGLQIVDVYGFGLWPYRLYRTRFAPLLKRIDYWAAQQRPLRWISHDLLFVCRPRASGSCP